jgi:hypothetical protein
MKIAALRRLYAATRKMAKKIYAVLKLKDGRIALNKALAMPASRHENRRSAALIRGHAKGGKEDIRRFCGK